MNRKTIILLTVLFGVIIGVLIAVILFQHTEMQQMVEQMEVEKSELQDEYEELAIQFDGYQNLDIKNDSLQNLLSQEQDRVHDLLEELRITKATNAKRIAELKKELATIRAVMMTYVEQIDSLNRTNTKLTHENKKIKQQNLQIKQQNTMLATRNTELEETVSIASRLEMANLTITSLNKNGRKTKMLKQIKKVQFDFTIVKNITAPRGDKTVFLRIVDPKGNLIQTNPSDIFAYESDSIGYTASQQFVFGGDALPLTMYWNMNLPAEAGFYNADFFIDSEMVGSYPFQLHK